MGWGGWGGVGAGYDSVGVGLGRLVREGRLGGGVGWGGVGGVG